MLSTTLIASSLNYTMMTSPLTFVIQIQTKNTQLTKGELLSIWFDNNIIYKQDGKISLREMCLSYFSYENIGVKEKSKFKKEIEKIFKYRLYLSKNNY